LRLGLIAVVVAGASSAHAQPLDTDPGTCDPYVIEIRSPKIGYGVELATGWQDSALPNEHRAWGFGLEVQRRLTNRFALVAHAMRTTGRDAGIDLDGNGRDDDGTGAVSRLIAVGGPSLRFALLQKRWFAQLDLLAGYTVMTSPGSEDGAIGGVDLSYRLAGIQIGVRALQGIGDARDTQLVVAHVGIETGAAPQASYGGGCSWVEREDKSRTGYGLDIALSGFGLGTGIGYMPPSIGFEAVYPRDLRIAPLARADLLVFLHGNKDHVVEHSLLAGARVDLHGPFFDVLAGYGWAAVTRPSSADSGPVADIAIGYAVFDSNVVSRLRLHGRFGLAHDNEDLRAIFASIGFDLRP
jgi:hypothetical protein